MIIDTLTIVSCCILIIMAVATPLFNALFRRPAADADAPKASQPPLSVIITLDDEIQDMERNLLQFLHQDYPAGYEVIVVDELLSDETKDLLNRLKADYPQLYTTFIPNSSHYLSRRKAAQVIGIKAAKHDWVLLTDMDCHPTSEYWLQAMAAHCDADTDMVCGYTSYEADARPFYIFERLLTSCYLMRQAATGKAYRYNGNNLLLRKQVFLDNHGFQKNLGSLYGEYDFIVNECAQPYRTAYACEPEARMLQEEPTPKVWHQSYLHTIDTCRHLKRSFLPRLLFCWDNLWLHLNYLLIMAAVVYALLLENWIILGTAVFSCLLTLTLRLCIARRAFCTYGETLALWRVPLLELRILWQDIVFQLRYLTRNRNDYRRR